MSAAYLRFAEEEAHDRSALYDELAKGVVSDPSVIAFLANAPREKRQPNLLFAATRLLFVTPLRLGEFEQSSERMKTLFGRSCCIAQPRPMNPLDAQLCCRCSPELPQPLALIEGRGISGSLPDTRSVWIRLRRTSGASRDKPTGPAHLFLRRECGNAGPNRAPASHLEGRTRSRYR